MVESLFGPALFSVSILLAAESYAGIATYSYDELHRLTQVTYDSGITVTYEYDELGNRTRRTVTPSAPPDSDGDGVPDISDSAPTDPFVCRDADADGCDDCSSGTDAPGNDGLDTDGDGACNVGDVDDDDDSVPDASDSAPLDPFVCRDLDADGCDDCTNGTSSTTNDGPDFDADGICDAGDSDDDDDGLPDNAETGGGTYVSPLDTGTDPFDADSDGDGFLDGAEVAAGSDPNDSNSTPGSTAGGNTHSIDLETANSQYLTAPDSASLSSVTGDLTFEAWIKLESHGPWSLASKWHGPTDQRSWQVELGYSGGVSNGVGLAVNVDGSTTGSGSAFISATFTLDTWYHIAVVYDADGGATNGEFELFVDGVSQGTSLGTLRQSIFDGSANLYLGAASGSQQFFDGLMDEVRVWNVAGTAAEIEADRLRQLSGDEPNLVAYWQYNEDLFGASPNLNDLSDVGGSAYSTDVPFGAGSIDLVRDLSQFASIPHASQVGLDITGDLTVEAWVKPESSGVDRAIVTKHDGDANQRSFYLGIYNDAVSFLVSENGNGGGAQSFSTADTPLTVGEWQHVAVTYEAATGTAIHYLNGVSDGQSSAHKTQIADRDAPLAVGASFDAGVPIHFYDGLIDDVRIWSRVRTPSEISDDLYATLAGDEAGLVSQWRFDQNLLDDTVNQNDLSSGGMPGFAADERPVPEPASPLALLFGSALLGTLASRRWRRDSGER